MALYIPLRDLIEATLPAGFGHVGFIGVAPGGGEHHVLRPVSVERAQALLSWSGWDPTLLGGRPGWTYRYVATYRPEAPYTRGKPDIQAVRAARLRRAITSGEEIVAWGRSHGWWVEIV